MDVVERVRATGLLPTGGPVVALLSGGRDSTCLLGVAAELCGAGAVRALHVNYGLRGEASDGDERHCEELCARLGVPLAVERARRPEDAGNLQAWARDVRYAAGARAVTSAGAGARLAAGHTVGDQVETILYRLASSPGRRALTGMAAASGALVRPLLAAGVTRAETAAWCAGQGLAWREDASNLDQTYARVRVREDLVPALLAVDPRAEGNLLRTAELLREEGAVLDELVAGVLAGRDHMPVAELAALPRAPPGGSTRCSHSARERSTSATAPGSWSSMGWCASDGRRLASLSASVPGHMRDPEIGEILVQPDELKQKVRDLGERISQDYAEKDLLLVCVLKGAVFFLADLMRSIRIPCEVDCMAVSSYGSATDSSGVVRILKDLDRAIEGRDVLIVEDIVDSGLTLQYLLRNLGARDPASLEVCALLTKPERRKVDLATKYVGFEIPDKFAIGYGLDHAEKHRNLPYVASLDEGDPDTA
jgi:hypoxanthine phosphoribosyltransferase